MRKVREAYLGIAKEYGFKIVDANRDRDIVASEVKNIVWEVLHAPI